MNVLQFVSYTVSGLSVCNLAAIAVLLTDHRVNALHFKQHQKTISNGLRPVTEQAIQPVQLFLTNLQDSFISNIRNNGVPSF
jgi:hypothetical protein